MATQYLCSCAVCKGERYVSYTTTRRHSATYGLMEDSGKIKTAYNIIAELSNIS